MKRIAIVSKFPIFKPVMAPERYMCDTAELLSKTGMHVEFFAISDKTKVSKTNDTYTQHEFGNARIHEYGLSAARMLDLLGLVLFRSRPMYESANSRNALLEEMKRYKPDCVIVWDYNLSKLVGRYRELYDKSAKLVFLSDSDKIIYDNLDSIINLLGEKPVNAFVARRARAIVGKKYLEYNLAYYRRQLDIADAIVVPSQETVDYIEKKYRSAKGKVHAISPQYIRTNEKNISAVKKKINTILFLGSLPFRPNAEAVDLIKSRIAPKLKEKNFIIVGKGVPKMVEGNVHYIGAVDDLNREIRNADLCIAPMISTSGRKTKVFDYFMNGKAVIGTSLAFQGYPVRNRQNAIVEDNIDNFARRIKDLDGDKALFAKLQKNSFGTVDMYSEAKVTKMWKLLFNEIGFYEGSNTDRHN